MLTSMDNFPDRNQQGHNGLKLHTKPNTFIWYLESISIQAEDICSTQGHMEHFLG